MTLCYERTQKKSNYWSSPPSRGFLSEKSIFMDELGERVFTLLSSVNHFYWTFFQASSGQGAYTRTHFESDPSSSRQRDSHCGKREQSKGKRGEWRQGEFQHESKCCYHTSVLSDWFTFDYSRKEEIRVEKKGNGILHKGGERKGDSTNKSEKGSKEGTHLDRATTGDRIWKEINMFSRTNRFTPSMTAHQGNNGQSRQRQARMLLPTRPIQGNLTLRAENPSHFRQRGFEVILLRMNCLLCKSLNPDIPQFPIPAAGGDSAL